ncbi:MAG: NfeD family protein [Marinifilaceae bacterium]
MKKLFFYLTFLLFSLSLFAQEQDTLVQDVKQDSVSAKKKDLVYRFNIRREIGPAIWRQTKQAFEEAKELKADYFVINMNTYGGAVVQADSIRTTILNAPMPVFVLIDNNAASAGALISIACDKIYMRKGANIGAATVVNQTGAAMPDKYQSYMRSIMRSTCEAQGKDTIINGQDTIFRYKRNPLIAEAMVDQRLAVKGIIDTSKVLTFTPAEAIKNGFCDGMAEDIPSMLKAENVEDYELAEYRASGVENIIGLLVNPIAQGILIMIIIGGIYFEFQTPGIGFPIAASALAAIVYFSPLYLEGLAANYEVIIFVIGVVLLAAEIFVIPGFGVAGVLGILGIVTGLALAMVDNYGFNFEASDAELVFRAFGIVFVSSFASFVCSLYLSKKLLDNRKLAFALYAEQSLEDGYVGVDLSFYEMIGKEGLAQTDLRPSGKVVVDTITYDAMSVHSTFIDKNSKIKVIRFETGQLYVEKI